MDENFDVHCVRLKDGKYCLIAVTDSAIMGDFGNLANDAVPGHRVKYRKFYEAVARTIKNVREQK